MLKLHNGVKTDSSETTTYKIIVKLRANIQCTNIYEFHQVLEVEMHLSQNNMVPGPSRTNIKGILSAFFPIRWLNPKFMIHTHKNPTKNRLIQGFFSSSTFSRKIHVTNIGLS